MIGLAASSHWQAAKLAIRVRTPLALQLEDHEGLRGNLMTRMLNHPPIHVARPGP